MVRSLARVIAVVVLAQGCTDPVDKAAKKRIFSPEDPPQVIVSAQEKLPPQDVADDPRVARRVLGMSAAEAVERIGPHSYASTITFEWSALGKNLRLTETRKLLAGPGGVSGDFHAVQENSRDQGLEVLRVRNEVFARSRYGKFRQRLRDRGMAERTRDETFGGIRDFDALFQGRIKLAAQGTATHEGRTAWKYVVSLGPPPNLPEKPLPPLWSGKDGGMDETTRRRQGFYAYRSPRALQGEVLVDADTSVVLKARLDGRLGVATDGGDAELRLQLESQMTGVGTDPQLKTPEEFLPDQDKPQGIAAALERFGIPRAGTDAGTAAPSGGTAPEPGDEVE